MLGLALLSRAAIPPLFAEGSYAGFPTPQLPETVLSTPARVGSTPDGPERPSRIKRSFGATRPSRWMRLTPAG